MELRDGAGQPIGEGDSGYVSGHGNGTRPSMYGASFTVIRVQRTRVLVNLAHPDGSRRHCAWQPGEYALDPRTLCVTAKAAGSRVIEQARKRAAELFAMAEDPGFLGI